MENEGSYVPLGLKAWKAQIDRADKLFRDLSFEDLLRRIAPGRNKPTLLVGTSDSHTRRDAAAVGSE